MPGVHCWMADQWAAAQGPFLETPAGRPAHTRQVSPAQNTRHVMSCAADPQAS